MPIYEYQCKKCHARLEKRQAISDDPLKECEKCGGELQKQWSLSGFQFKGEGWYVTDYSAKKGAAEKTAADDKAPAPPSAGGAADKPKAAESTTSTDAASKSKSEPAPKAGDGLPTSK